MVDSSTSRCLRSIRLNKQIQDDLQIEVKQQSHSTVTLGDHECCFFYYSQNSVYFQDSISTEPICGNQIGVIKALLLLNSIYLSIFTDKWMMVADVRTNESEKVFELENDDEIELIESTIPKQTVFSSDYLDDVDGITIIVGLKLNKTIRVYRFDRKNEKKVSLISELDSIKYDCFGFYKSRNETLWRDSLIIESTFLIDNTEKGKLNEALIRFCFQCSDGTADRSNCRLTSNLVCRYLILE